MSDENRTRIIRPRDMPDKGVTRKVEKDAEIAPKSPSLPEESDQVRTTIISSHRGSGTSAETERAESSQTAPDPDHDYELVVGWLVIVKGPGKGCSLEIYYGMNSIGRGPQERICLDYGDSTISREAHAYVTYDEKQADFYISHGGKSNLVRLNDKPVLAPEALKQGDRIEMGKTHLMFVPLCNESFNWEGDEV
ncbi:MAG: FHA domain-containing protein [Cohaesibacter sp.]|nr:FHA domain-containing protein [Cohaesibacter sp.]